MFEILVSEARLLTARWAKRQDEVAREQGQTRASWQVLAAASDGDHTVSDLARRLQQSRQGLQRVADRLVEKGLATYERNPSHRRSPLLRLSESGQTVLRALERDAARRKPDLESDLDPDDIETAVHVVRAVREAL